MKKITGKALSLVLSLALVVSSFSATFANAATTKTEYLGTKDSGTAVEFVNGRSGDASATDVTSYIPYSITAETQDHLTVAGMTAQDIAMKDGQDLLSWKVDSTTSKITLSLKDASLAGKETIAVRYTATNHRYTAPTQDILFSAVVTYTVKVYANNSYAVNLSDTSIDKYGTIVNNKMTTNVSGTVDQYILKDSGVGGSQNTKGSLADTVSQPVSVATKQDGSFDLTNVAAGTFCVKVSSSNKVDMTTPAAKQFGLTLTAPTSADFLNQGSLVAYAVPTTTTNNNTVALDTAHTVTATATVTNTVTLPAAQNAIKTWHGSTWAVKSTDTIDEKATGIADPLNSSAKIPAADAINVTGANVILRGKTTMDGNCVVGDVIGLGDQFVMSNGYAKSVTVGEFDMTKGSVGSVVAGTVVISGGTTGAITAAAGTVKLDAADAKVATKVGAITAKTVEIKSTNAAVTTGAIKMTGTANAVDAGAATGDKITVNGDKITVPSIDFDKYSTTLELKGYTGTIAAPANSDYGTINVVTDTANNNAKSNATITGAVNVKNVQIVEGTLNIATGLNVGSIGGAGTLVIPAGKMYISDSITGISLKLSDKQLSAGMTVFNAAAYKVYDGMFTPVGFTIDYDAISAVANRTTDVFKIKTVNFAGLTIAPVSGTSNKVVQGDKATFKVSSYPYGTNLPDNTKIKIDFSGAQDNFTYDVTADTITVTAKKYDDLFSSLNKGTITATLVDKDTENQVYTFDPATYDVQMIKTPEVSFKSDTTGNLNKKIGETYQFKITSADGSAPVFAVASNGATVVANGKSGNDYFFKVTPAKVGSFGVYVSGTKVAVLVVTSDVKCDTSKVTVAAGKTYQFKVTAPKEPTFVVATVGTIKLASKNGNDYFYKVTATKAAGAHGVYINGALTAVITFA
ncbi:MAG TPA: hypothetical protein VHP31_10645 [Caproicibacter sp.]|nr:hypothetical protein [Caproicibacter sp.]